MAGPRPGHLRLPCLHPAKTWMPGTSPGMTRISGSRKFVPGITCAGLGVGHDPFEDRRASLEVRVFFTRPFGRLSFTIPSLVITNAGAPIFGKANALDRPKFPTRRPPFLNNLRLAAVARAMVSAASPQESQLCCSTYFAAIRARHCLDSRFPRRYGPARLPPLEGFRIERWTTYPRTCARNARSRD